MRNIQVVSNLPFRVQIEDITDQLYRHNTERWDMRRPEDVKRIIVHHMASEAPLNNQAMYHVNTHGWPGIAYHLCVSEGKLKQTNDLLSLTYHAASNNDDTVAISIHGDLSKRELRSDERELLYAGILTLKSLFPNAEVLAHSEVNATSCPCTSIQQIRQDILNLEMQMKYAQSAGNKKAVAFTIANQILFLANLAQGKLPDGSAATPGQIEWAINSLMELEPFMRERSLL